MAIVFNQVPDWQSFENQGGNVAVAELDGNGTKSMLVLRIDQVIGRTPMLANTSRKIFGRSRNRKMLGPAWACIPRLPHRGN
jgi:hypothetical protein